MISEGKMTDTDILAALAFIAPGEPISLHRHIPRNDRLPRWTLHIGGVVVAAGPLARCVDYLLRETRSVRARLPAEADMAEILQTRVDLADAISERRTP